PGRDARGGSQGGRRLVRPDGGRPVLRRRPVRQAPRLRRPARPEPHADVLISAGPVSAPGRARAAAASPRTAAPASAAAAVIGRRRRLANRAPCRSTARRLPADPLSPLRLLG